MGLSFTVLGCSGSYPGPGRACSGYLVQAGDTHLTLDLGTGSLANLQQHLALDALDAVVLSHAHPDHWVDLSGLRVALRYGLEQEGLVVLGTEQTLTAAETICGDLEPTIVWWVVDDGDEVTIGDARLRFAATDHWVPTLAARVDHAGRALAYSADTGPSWSFDTLGTGIDLALCEATSLADGEGDDVLHLSARQAGAIARASGIPRLVLTHLWPTVDPQAAVAEGAEAFGAPVELAVEHAVFEV